MDFDVIKPLLKEDQKSKIVLLVMDGLGGLPMTEGGKTELESAVKPNMDALAARSILGAHHPLPFGLTPGVERRTSVCSVLTLLSTKSGAACFQRWALTSTCKKAMWLPAATSAPLIPKA